jgi:hypothetical protein
LGLPEGLFLRLRLLSDLFLFANPRDTLWLCASIVNMGGVPSGDDGRVVAAGEGNLVVTSVEGGLMYLGLSGISKVEDRV